MKYVTIKVVAMSIEDAKKILGLDKNSDLNVRDAWKKASKKHHPDKGGSTEMQKKVNEAYETLKDKRTKPGPGSGKYNMPTKEERQEKDRKTLKKAKIVEDLMRKAFNPEAYNEYFKKFVGKPINYEENIRRPKQTGYGLDGDHVSFNYEFSTADRETVFYINLITYLYNADFSKSLGGGSPNVNLKYSTDNYLYHNKRKQKMKQRTWDLKESTSDIIDPKKLFPPATLKKVFAGKKQRKFMPRDFRSGLIRELKANMQGNDAYIPLKDELKLILFRTTFMREGVWNANGLYDKHTRLDTLSSTSIPETEVALTYLINLVKAMRKKKDWKAMKDLFNKNITFEKTENLWNKKEK